VLKLTPFSKAEAQRLGKREFWPGCNARGNKNTTQILITSNK
jgi:hypothetical protein